jgi:hypothetical protein
MAAGWWWRLCMLFVAGQSTRLQVRPCYCSTAERSAAVPQPPNRLASRVHALQGRRVRQVEAEKKLKEWAAQSKERELEKIAQQHIRDLARQQRQERDYEVRPGGASAVAAGCCRRGGRWL